MERGDGAIQNPDFRQIIETGRNSSLCSKDKVYRIEATLTGAGAPSQGLSRGGNYARNIESLYDNNALSLLIASKCIFTTSEFLQPVRRAPQSLCTVYTVRIGEFAVVPAQGSTALIAIPTIALAHPYSGLLPRAKPMLSRFK
jgi:hypothetical protein